MKTKFCLAESVLSPSSAINSDLDIQTQEKKIEYSFEIQSSMFTIFDSRMNFPISLCLNVRTVPATLYFTFLSYSIVPVSYPIVRVSNPVMHVSYPVFRLSYT